MKRVLCKIHKDARILIPSTIEEIKNFECGENSLVIHLFNHSNEGCEIIVPWFQKAGDYNGS